LAFKKHPTLTDKDIKSLWPQIMDESKFQAYLKKVGSAEAKINARPGTSNMVRLDQESALLQLKSMDCTVNTKLLRTMMTGLSYRFANGIEGIYVDEPKTKQLKDMLENKKKVILLPTYKSFIDIFILYYTLYMNKIDIPFTLGNLEDTPRSKVMDQFLQSIGYILSRRTSDQSL